MEIIIWKQEMSVGVDSMDNEHKILFSIYNDLVKSANEHRGGEGLRYSSEVWERLYNFINTHFDNEERLMLESGYDDIERHILEHENFIRRIVKMHESVSFNSGNILQLCLLLRGWLLNHIAIVDRGYAIFVQKSQGKQ